MATADTKDRLLDAAEALFAEHGLAGTSLRNVTARADANLAAVHYHFGSKEALFQAVLARRIRPLNEERLRLLEALEERGGTPEVEAVVDALVGPIVRFKSARAEEAERFTRLMGRILTDARSDELLMEHFGEVAVRFCAALTRALPELPAREVLWRFHFGIGSMAFTLLHAEQVLEVSGGLCDARDADGLVARLVAYTAAGMRAPVPSGVTS